MNIVDLGQIGYTLQQSLTNLQQFQDQYFDIFINPQPMMVNIQNIDPTTGEIVNLTIPNFAQLQLQVAQWVQSENGTGGYMYLPSVHIAGDLFVDGNSIVLDSSTMNVGDSFIELNTNMTSGQGITDAGMMIYRGSENPVMLFPLPSRFIVASQPIPFNEALFETIFTYDNDVVVKPEKASVLLP
jgi:hypothetical protein